MQGDGAGVDAYGVEGGILVLAEEEAALHGGGAGEGVLPVEVDGRGELAVDGR